MAVVEAAKLTILNPLVFLCAKQPLEQGFNVQK